MEASSTRNLGMRDAHIAKLDAELASVREQHLKEGKAAEGAYDKAAEELETLYEKKLAIEAARYMALRDEYDKLVTTTKDTLDDEARRSARAPRRRSTRTTRRRRSASRRIARRSSRTSTTRARDTPR